MKITPDIIRHEFIGTQATVTESLHSDYVGISGKIIDETKNTLIFQKEGNTKQVIKNSSIFNFMFTDGTIVEINGRLLVGRPEDRLKKSLKRLW
jgi:ribonuclease P protein subunit POP4